MYKRESLGDKKMERVTVCVLKGEPELPDDVEVIAGISGDWSFATAHNIGVMLTLDFNYLRAKLGEKFGMKIPTIVIEAGRTVYTDEDI